jgi:hypothetical protein
MACYTVVDVQIEDNELNRQARKKLGLPEVGSLTYDQANAVKKEAGILRTHQVMRRLNPTAVIRRVGDKLTISVQA